MSKIILILFFLLSTNQNNKVSEEVLTIKIERISFSDLCIQGNLWIENKRIGYTLELPDVDNHKDVSSIKSGTYLGQVRDGGRLGWRIELLDVENRKNIQIHIGNIRDNSRGCILVGSSANAEDCTIGASKTMIGNIKNAYYSTGNSNKKILITITN